MKMHVDIKYGPAIEPGPRVRLHRDLPGVSDHAQQRAAERISAPMTREIWLLVVLDILDRRAALLSDTVTKGARREIWLCIVAGRPMRVVWSPDGGLVITILPLRKRSLSHQLLHIDAPKRGRTKPTARRALARERDWECVA